MIQFVGRIGAGVFVLSCALMVVVPFVGSFFRGPLLAYSMGGDLYARDLWFDQTLQLTFDGQRYIDQFPAWSPDGRALAFTRQLGLPYSAEDPDADVYWMTLDRARRVRLTDDENNDSVPQWSPDGSHILYLSMAPTGHKAQLISPDGSGLTTLPIPIPQRIHTTLRWTSDGSKVLLHLLQDKNITPMVYDLATGELRPIAPIVAYYPAPSPDGSHVAALIPARGGDSLALLTADPVPRLLTDSLPPRIGVVWSDNEHLLFLSENRLSLIQVDIITGQQTTLYTFPDHVMSFAYQR